MRPVLYFVNIVGPKVLITYLTDVTHPDSFFDKKRAQKLISAVETRCIANQCQKREARDAMHSKSMPETRGRRRFAIASLQR